jgi:hypothetical protein
MTGYTAEDEARLLQIRKTIIVAIASDEALMERLVLKGGQALDVIYKISERASLDVDFSMADDFKDAADLEEFSGKLFRALRDRFDSIGYVVFDERVSQRPPVRPGKPSGPGLPVWGGYNATFKLISRAVFVEVGGVPGTPMQGKVLEAAQRQSQVIGPSAERRFTIEISKFEYTQGRVLQSVDDYTCYVYTPAMIGVEKLRAICQQSPRYPLRRHPAPRPRDFLDVHTITVRAGCDLTSSDHDSLVLHMFAAKEVRIELLSEIGSDESRAFHGQAWSSVEIQARGRLKPFEFYFEFTSHVAALISERLGGRDAKV